MHNRLADHCHGEVLICGVDIMPKGYRPVPTVVAFAQLLAQEGMICSETCLSCERKARKLCGDGNHLETAPAGNSCGYEKS